MKQYHTALLLLFAVAAGAHAQRPGRWASARERGLKGPVHTVTSKCTDRSGKYVTRFKYTFARDGRLTVIEAPQLTSPIFQNPLPSKVTRRNNRGDVEEVSYFDGGEVLEKWKAEYEYDAAGNWVKLATFEMRTYEVTGVDWPAGEWRASGVCSRQIEYYR